MSLRIHSRSIWNAILWFVSNAAMGLAPLMFLVVFNPILDDNQATPEINRLVEGGIILFVCCALMGAVIIDILIERLKFRNFAFFTLNVAPFVLLGIICILYLLMILKHLKHPNIFTTLSGFYIFVIIFTIVYCILGKYLLYYNKKEGK